MSRADITPRREEPSSPDPSSGAGRGWVLPLVVALLVIAVFVFIRVAKYAEKPKASPESAPAVPAEPAVVPVTNVAPAVPAPVEAVTNTLSTNAAASLKLQGIVFKAKQPFAIVDGKTVSVGSRVGAYRVKEISPSALTLQDTNGSSRTLYLGK
jgi:hypothetical protein